MGYQVLVEPSYPISPVLSSSFTINRSSGTGYPSYGPPPPPCSYPPPLLPRRPPFPLTGLLKNRFTTAARDDHENHFWRDDGGPPPTCLICNRESKHILQHCPFLTLATHHLDVFKTAPPSRLNYSFYFANYQDMGTRGEGGGRYILPGEGDEERSAADAMSLHMDGIYLLRITNLPEDVREPQKLYKLFAETDKSFVTHVIVFPDQGFGFVGFLTEEAAKRDINKFKDSFCGDVTWATRVIVTSDGTQ